MTPACGRSQSLSNPAGGPADRRTRDLRHLCDGGRPSVLAEVQALLTPSAFGNPRRSTNGFDYNRAMLLLAVLEKRGGLLVSTCDAYLNVIGGLNLEEPAADLAAMLALASSFRDRVVPADLVAVGEVGLTGELRSVSALNQRLAEGTPAGLYQVPGAPAPWPADHCAAKGAAADSGEEYPRGLSCAFYNGDDFGCLPVPCLYSMDQLWKLQQRLSCLAAFPSSFAGTELSLSNSGFFRQVYPGCQEVILSF